MAFLRNCLRLDRQNVMPPDETLYRVETRRGNSKVVTPTPCAIRLQPRRSIVAEPTAYKGRYTHTVCYPPAAPSVSQR